MAQAKPKVLLILHEGHDGLFQLDWQRPGGRMEPEYEHVSPDVVYQRALIFREQLKQSGYDVAVDVRSRLFK